MSAANLTALIGAITALITAAIGLITLIVHIKNHQPITPDKPVGTASKPGMISPTRRRWDYQ